jgi:tripartite-type tricarboxylate transporter receptor subunit TctC
VKKLCGDEACEEVVVPGGDFAAETVLCRVILVSLKPFAFCSASVEHIRAGKLRPLAVTTATRWDDLPEIPTVGEFVPGFEASTWFGVGTPRNTPAEIVNKLNQEINAALNDPRLRARISELGAVPFISTPNSLATFVAAETEKWGKVIRAATNIKP